jgi:hypothetical protein
VEALVHIEREPRTPSSFTLPKKSLNERRKKKEKKIHLYEQHIERKTFDLNNQTPQTEIPIVFLVSLVSLRKTKNKNTIGL